MSNRARIRSPQTAIQSLRGGRGRHGQIGNSGVEKSEEAENENEKIWGGVKTITAPAYQPTLNVFPCIVTICTRTKGTS
jgi:hypothetical protein